MTLDDGWRCDSCGSTGSASRFTREDGTRECMTCNATRFSSLLAAHTPSLLRGDRLIAVRAISRRPGALVHWGGEGQARTMCHSNAGEPTLLRVTCPRCLSRERVERKAIAKAEVDLQPLG